MTLQGGRRRRRGRGGHRDWDEERKKGERRRDYTTGGEPEDKRGERWSGRTGAERFSFGAPALLNSSAGVQGGLGEYGEWDL